ncbi:flagellar protein FlaI [Methanomicrobium sp. W14]|uniref:type II/IV secretion system ATPase subunit n=1 Tax=Methanomicrobium sp. W14 TaxID=2817839 RepID=UPI001FD9E7E7|nr:type II/IV secretion system ATPase subunit [Methanomicrobium sp. W14]MBP2133481.1 flagellar protein FlaI [Methanomicrobium sp. W14]
MKLLNREIKEESTAAAVPKKSLTVITDIIKSGREGISSAAKSAYGKMNASYNPQAKKSEARPGEKIPVFSFSEIKEKVSKFLKSSSKTEKTEIKDPVDEIIPYGEEEHYELPAVDEYEKDLIVERYWLAPPFSYVKIVKNWEMDLEYVVVEPKVTEEEYVLLEETYEELRNIMVYTSPGAMENLKFEEKKVKEIIKSFDPEIPEERLNILVYYLRRNFSGFGKLDPLMKDPGIEDITCNGSDIPIFIYHRRYANLVTNIVFSGEELNKYALKIAQKGDKQMSLTTPLVDAALPGGSRAQITYSDVISSKGSSFTIRKFKGDPMTPVDLIRLGTYSSELLAIIWLCVENGKSMIVVGGTASGKTSTMNAISFFIPPVAKIVSIEDTREILLPHKNWLPMKTREGGRNFDSGDVDMFTLLKASLRQRPEFIIVGEVRGREAQTLFQAMNTGHTTFSTLHAGGVNEAINRLTHDPINVPPVMFGALDLMIIQGLQHKGGYGYRRCLSVNEMKVDDGVIRWNPLYKWNLKTDVFERTYTESKALEDIAYTNGWTFEELYSHIDMRKRLLERMTEKKIYDINEISHFIHELRKKTYNAD